MRVGSGEGGDCVGVEGEGTMWGVVREKTV